MLEGPFSREWYFGEQVARQSLQSAKFNIPLPPPVGIRYTNVLDWAQIQKFRRSFRITDFLEEGDYGAFVATFMMRLFSVPPPAPVPRRHDETGPSRASARYDKAVPSEGSDDGPTEEHWRVTVTDIYGDQFTHHFLPVPEVDSSGWPAKVCMSTFT